MITSVVGKIFLDAYNEKYGTKYDAKSFFADVYFPLFYGQGKYMMSPGNNPIENPKISWEKMIKGNIPYEPTEKRRDRYDKLMLKIETGVPSTENAIAYASNDLLSTTSGQTSNLSIKNCKDDILNSWIGASLGLCVQGGYSLLLFDKNILLDIYEGWSVYRKFLDETKLLKGNQITTWNSRWLVHRYSKSYSNEYPMKNIDVMVPASGKYNGCLEIGLTTWIKVLYGISQMYKESRIMSYIYSLGQTNKTIGFIPCLLDEIRRPFQFYMKIFGMNDGNIVNSLYGYDTKGLEVCCQRGIVGLKAMEPKILEKYMIGIKGKSPELPKYDNKNEEKIISFRTYQIWILAMLNNQDLWDKSMAFAKAIRHYETSDNKALSKKRSNAVMAILEATNKKNFIEALTEIVGEAENKEQIVAIANEVNTMPTDNVPYFLTLVRFQYASI